MIKNAVFDLGNVLLSFNPAAYALRIGIPEEKRGALVEAVVRSKEWSDYDRGVIKDKRELCEKVTAKNPGLAPEIACFLRNWEELLTEIPGSAALVKKLKGEGYRVFLLSNLSYDGKNYALRFPFLDEFEGTLFSCDVHRNKPEPEIFHILFDRYGLKAGETVFFDDHPPNIEGAKALGIHAVLFRDAEDAEAEFRRLADG